MPSIDKVSVKLSVDIEGMLGPLLAAQTTLLHHLLESAGFERTGEWIVQHMGSGVMVAVNEDGYRISYYCPEARNASGRVDLPPSATVGEVAHVALALHRSDEEDSRCPELDCGEPLRLIESGAVGHCGAKCGN